MKLQSLRVHGFKSFPDSTEIDFHEGVTAIVGPNGCGKSNISDAIRWVLGEQRPTAIRGSKMEEAIFQGSVNRRPVSRGSVTMVVSNEDGSLPVPFEEVAIGRTVYRDGGSEYSLNRSSCRLKDVVDLVRDTGLGANAYNVIENRMVDAILSDRADERRSLFEEAAGIGKYKDRRKTASRRLERAEGDLQRLEDVIAEVQTKVRSLARQKGKAERWSELRSRRLSVEVAVVRGEIGALRERLSEVEARLEGETGGGEGMAAELRTAESEFESLRLRQVEVEKARREAAVELERVRSELVRWEKELAVASERQAAVDRRLEQIEGERTEARERLTARESEAAELKRSLEEREAGVEEARRELEARRATSSEVRERLREARDSLEEVEGREREVARRSAQLEGDAESAEAQAAELERRLERLREEMEEGADALSDLRSQGDLFTDRTEGLTREAEELRRSFAERRGAVASARESLESARAREIELRDRAGELGSRVAALERMERDREGIEPVVQGVLEAGLEGVEGVLADFLEVEEGVAALVEAYLGPLTRGVVMRDRAAADALVEWFAGSWSGGGGLLLLPLDDAGEAAGPLPEGVDASGAGAPWVRTLLGGVRLLEGADELSTATGTRWVSPRAASSGEGVVRVGNPLGATDLLERRKRLQSLRMEAAEAESAAGSATEEREAARARVDDAEEALEQVRDRLREVEGDLLRAEAEAAAQVDRRARIDRQQDEIARQIEGARASRERALERARSAREDREALLAEEETLRERREEARASLEGVQEEWEAARSAESGVEIRLTRIEGETERARDRLEEVRRAREAASERIRSLGAEEERLREEAERVAELREKGAGATERLFEERDRAEELLRERDRALAEVADALSEAESRVRRARTEEREATEERHRLQLEKQELDGRIGRIQDRLEGEWGRPLERLLEEAEPVEGEPEALRRELREIVEGLERIGPVNMLAVEEHEEESLRLSFLEEQRDDLVEARDDLRSAIRQINETATGLFEETFEAIRTRFRETFLRLFDGGEADLWLEEPDDPLESPIEIHASPRGKRTQKIDLLSGGERALTALSLLFGIYLVKPSPFCVLDEVDAPLDESNIGRFIKLLQDFKDETQFVVITHNPRTIEAADWIYGVTMEEPGVSNVVGVRLQDALEVSGSAA